MKRDILHAFDAIEQIDRDSKARFYKSYGKMHIIFVNEDSHLEINGENINQASKKLLYDVIKAF